MDRIPDRAHGVGSALGERLAFLATVLDLTDTKTGLHSKFSPIYLCEFVMGNFAHFLNLSNLRFNVVEKLIC